VLDLSGLAVESVEVVPASSLDSVAYGHGALELGASSSVGCGCNANNNSQCSTTQQDGP
jgi:hypothetical protein